MGRSRERTQVIRDPDGVYRDGNGRPVTQMTDKDPLPKDVVEEIDRMMQISGPVSIRGQLEDIARFAIAQSKNAAAQGNKAEASASHQARTLALSVPSSGNLPNTSGPDAAAPSDEAPTPRTDALLLEINEGRVYEENGPLANHARQLERELAEERSYRQTSEHTYNLVLQRAEAAEAKLRASPTSDLEALMADEDAKAYALSKEIFTIDIIRENGILCHYCAPTLAEAIRKAREKV